MTIPVIDCLTHISIGPDDVIGWGPRFLAEDLLALMDTPRRVLGEMRTVDKAVVFPALGLTVPTSPLSFEEQHAYVAECVARYPDRLIGGIALQPRLWSDAVADRIRYHLCTLKISRRGIDMDLTPCYDAHEILFTIDKHHPTQ